MSYQINKRDKKMNTKLIGSLIGYTLGKTLARAIVVTKLVQDDLVIVKDEKTNESVIINSSQIKWING